MIVDAHVHAGIGRGPLTAPWNAEARLGRYRRRADAAGIDVSILVGLFQPDTSVANRQVGEIVSREPDRFVGFVSVHPKRDAGGVGRIVDDAIERWGFKGIKVHRLQAPLTREVCDVARACRLPILYDVVDRTELVDVVAEEFPEVDFIVPHLGSFGDDWRSHARVVEQLVRYPNLHADTSAVRRFDFLVEAVERAGAHKLIFGSDGPWMHPGLELEKIRLLRLPAADEELVLAGNVLRLLGEQARRPQQRARIRAASPYGRPGIGRRGSVTWPDYRQSTVPTNRYREGAIR